MKLFNKNILYLLLITIGFLSMISLISCKNDDVESPYVKGPKEMTLLIYAVGSNNLESNLKDDKNEKVS